MLNPFSLNGKKILVTGASSGIGKATAIECSKLGASLILTGRDKNRLNETFSLLAGEDHKVIVTDILIESEIFKLVESIPEIDGLVNAAGLVKTLPFQFINRDDLSIIFETNFYGPVNLTQKILKARKFLKGSSIVFISSIDGPVIAHPGNSMYSASKGAVSAIVKNMAIDLAIKNIRVNCVLPGMTETPMINLDLLSSEQIEDDKKRYPLKRYGKPEEIAYSVIYLLSDASSWVTGLNLIIDGGYTLL
jgi:NAD(P)-dependent dehydrogenase (short-subunit alcohol dehydrogenase family)